MNRISARPSEKGATTLIITLVLLLLSALVMFYTGRNAINEQRLSANEVRTKQAYDAAGAGIDHALAYFAKGGLDQDSDGTVDTLVPTTLYSGTQRPSYYQAAYCSPAAAVPSCPAAHGTAMTCTVPTSSELRKPAIVACGWSDDDTSVIRLVQYASGSPSMAGKITAPVVSKGATNMLTGGASVLNYFNDLTIWSGGNVPIQSNTGKTFIRNVSTDPTPTSNDYRSTGNSPSCNNPPTGYVCSTDGKNLGPDAIINDTALSSLTSDQFFANFMGKTPTLYRDTVATWKVDLGNTLSDEDSTTINSLSGKQDKVIWVDGNASSLPDTIGTADHPVVLVINGDLDLSSNTVINGLVYVRGSVSGNGSPTVYGAMVVEGATNTNGNLKVIYDPNTLGKAGDLGKGAGISGSWRDW